jgi:hypothetical protein
VHPSSDDGLHIAGNYRVLRALTVRAKFAHDGV